MDIITIKCPHCKKRKKAERKNLYFQDMGCGEWFLHFFLLLITAAAWIGFLLVRYFMYGKKNYCLTCKKQVADQHIV